MKYITVISALILAVVASSAAAASEIYKWTDDEGNVHYTDTPMGDPSERLDIHSRDTDTSAIQAQTQARLDRQAAKAQELADKPKEPTAAELQAERKSKAEECSAARSRLTVLLQSRRIYREDANGERVYLDESDTQAARDAAQKQVEESCGH